MSTDPSWPGPRWRRPFERVASRHRDSSAVRAATTVLEHALEILRAADHDPAQNGERRALASIAPGASVVFDVGANVGVWTRLAHSVCPAAVIHAFEIAEPTRIALRRHVADLDRVTVAEVGLDERAGVVRVKHYESAPVVSSTVDYPHALPHSWRDERVESGDGYLERTGVDHVDYLKIDVEGAELRVLRGFERALGDGRIGAVQFEHGRAGIPARSLLLDFHDLLEPLGFVIGRVRRDRVDVRPYRMTDESFLTANYVAVRER